MIEVLTSEKEFDKDHTFTIIRLEMGEIGSFIRSQRKLRGWTLQELAERCNLSVGFLSQVERGISSLSILSLNTICEVMGIPLFDLFNSYNKSQDASSASQAPSKIVKIDERPNIQISSGSIKYQFLSGEFPGRQFEILIGEIPSNYHYPPAAHGGEEFGYVLHGKLLLKIAEDAHELSPGDSYHFLATTPHGYEAGDPEGVKVLWVQSLKYETWRRVGRIRDSSGEPAKA